MAGSGDDDNAGEEEQMRLLREGKEQAHWRLPFVESAMVSTTTVEAQGLNSTWLVICLVLQLVKTVAYDSIWDKDCRD